MKQLLLPLILFPLWGISQGNYASSLQATSGYTEDGFAIMTSYDYYVQKDKYFQFSVFISFNKDKQENSTIPYNLFAIQPAYFYTIIKPSFNSKFGVNLGGGGILGFESVQTNASSIADGAIVDARDGFIYGLFAGSEIEYHLPNDKWSLILHAAQHFYINSDIGQFTPFIALGIKYYLF